MAALKLTRLVSCFALFVMPGVKLYHSARLGEEVLRAARPIVVSEYSVWRDDPHGQDVHFRVRCSKGTYIRSLAHDLVRRGLCLRKHSEAYTA